MSAQLRKSRLTFLTLAVASLTALSACALEPTIEDTTWELVGQTDIVSMSSAPGMDQSRIEIYECSTKASRNPLPFGPTQARLLPDGSSMRDQHLRVDIHVPPGGIVDSEELLPESEVPRG